MAHVAIEAQLRPLIPDFLMRVRSDIAKCRIAVLSARNSTLRQLCHKNKGCCAMFGFNQLSLLFATLEQTTLAKPAALPRQPRNGGPTQSAPAWQALVALERYAAGLEVRYH